MEKILNRENKPIVVYTALFGDYDFLIDPREAYADCDFICFTDQESLQTEIWKPVMVNKKFSSPTVANRYFKWLPHLCLQEYEYSLYLDSNIILYTNPCELVKEYLSKADIAMPGHPFRECLYEEAIACIRENKLSLFQALRQVNCYRRSGYPENHGLLEQGIVLRRHNCEDVKKTMELMWGELKKWGTFRDQITFPYLAWKTGVNFLSMNENSRQGNKFIYMPHRKRHRFWKKLFISISLRKRIYLDANILRVYLKFTGLSLPYDQKKL